MNIYLTPEEIIAVPSGETVYNGDGSMDVRASRINRELEVAKASADNAVRVILDEIKNPFAYPESEEERQRYLGFETFRDVLRKLTKPE